MSTLLLSEVVEEKEKPSFLSSAYVVNLGPQSRNSEKNENDPKEEDDLQWKMTFDGRQSLIDDNL